MNPHAQQPTSPLSLIKGLISHKSLIFEMSRRDVIGRYKGSILGLGWSFFNPLLMLLVYTFVFSFVLEARWGIHHHESKTDFALILFVGLIIHAFFAESLNSAPRSILTNVNYVKKVIFPLEILPSITLATALVHLAISLFVLLCSIIMIYGYIHWTILYLPIVLAPCICLALGLVWILASLGVYIRDVGYTMNILTTVMLFLAPILYPMSKVPEDYQPFLYLNPLTFIVEETRKVVLFGQGPDWSGLGIYTLISLFTAWAGFWWFQKTRKGFADVV